MKTLNIRPQAAYVAVLVALAVGAIGCAGCAGCAGKAERAATQPSVASEPPAPERAGVEARAGARVIELGPQTLNFAPTRDDLTVGCAVLAVVSSHPVRVNGVEAKRWNYIYLKQVGKNQFELPALRIEFAPDGPETIGCMSVKIWFNEVTNYTDSQLYEHEHRDDRYALVSWCTNPPELMKDTSYKARFGENRVQTLSEFRQRLTQPFPLRMNQTPLRADWGYPMTKGYGRELSEAELKAVKQLMRDRGEQYLISIGGRDSTHADVGASIGDMTRYHGVRHYQLALEQGVWRVQSVVEEPNISMVGMHR